MAYQFILSERDGPIERLTLNRPDVRNALNEVVIAELTDWASRIEAEAKDHRVRAVLLAGNGPAFCAGADIAWLSKTIDYSEADNLRDALTVGRMFAALDQLSVPVVGRVHGAALGGGCGLAAVCDIVVAEDHTMFGFTETKLGILPAIISPLVLAKIGRSAARELFLTGARFSAQRAREIGLIHAVTPFAELDATVDGYIRELRTAGPEAVMTAKALIRDVSARSMDDALPVTARALASRRVSTEGQEGLRAFLERRKPSWSDI